MLHGRWGDKTYMCRVSPNKSLSAPVKTKKDDTVHHTWPHTNIEKQLRRFSDWQSWSVLAWLVERKSRLGWVPPTALIRCCCRCARVLGTGGLRRRSWPRGSWHRIDRRTSRCPSSSRGTAYTADRQSGQSLKKLAKRCVERRGLTCRRLKKPFLSQLGM